MRTLAQAGFAQRFRVKANFTSRRSSRARRGLCLTKRMTRGVFKHARMQASTHARSHAPHVQYKLAQGCNSLGFRARLSFHQAICSARPKTSPTNSRQVNSPLSQLGQQNGLQQLNFPHAQACNVARSGKQPAVFCAQNKLEESKSRSTVLN